MENNVMYNLDFETFRKLVDVYNFLNQLEVKGLSNLQILYNSIYTLQEVVQKLNEQTQKADNPSVTVVPKKEGG